MICFGDIPTLGKSTWQSEFVLETENLQSDKVSSVSAALYPSSLGLHVSFLSDMFHHFLTLHTFLCAVSL